MQTVKIKKDELLGIVRTNREQHRAIFLEAQVGFRAQAVAELDNMLERAKAGGRIPRSWSLLAPIDQTKEYDRVLKMLEMSVDDVIELSQIDFARYVMDDWEWREQFLASNARYSKMAEDIVSASQV